jgi:hypothetical protein
LNVLIVLLVIMVFTGTFLLIVTYNKTVDMAHDISAAKAELDSIGAKSTTMNNNLIATLGGNQVQSIASTNNLVEEKKPQYVTIDKKWPLASQ